MSTPTSEPRYKLFFTVPNENLEACKDALFATGAGTYPGGKYIKACFETQGKGQFMPAGEAKPRVGAVDKMEFVEESKVEVLCVGKEVMVKTVDVLKKAHSYEEVVYEVYKMENI